MNKDAYWFKHDSNAQDDPKCMTLIDQLGMEGYGIFWALIEKLRNESEFKLHISVCGSLAKRWCTSKEKVEAVVLKYNLFSIENDFIFFSERLSQSMNYKKRIASKNAKSRWELPDAIALQPHSNGNAIELQPHSNGNAVPIQTDAMREDKRRGEENRVEKNIIIPPSEDMCKMQLWVIENCPNVSKLKYQLKTTDCDKLIKKYPRGIIVEVLNAMENKADLLKKYRSVYLTCDSWLRRKTPDEIEMYRKKEVKSKEINYTTDPNEHFHTKIDKSNYGTDLRTI
jgi:hypothetical protein